MGVPTPALTDGSLVVESFLLGFVPVVSSLNRLLEFYQRRCMAFPYGGDVMQHVMWHTIAIPKNWFALPFQLCAMFH